MSKDLLNDFATEPEELIKPKLWVIITWFSLLMLSLFMVLMHWPGSHVFLLISTGGLGGYVLCFLILSRVRRTLLIPLTVLSLSWTLYLLYGWLFRDGVPYNVNGTALYTFVFLLTYSINHLIQRKKRR